MSNFKLSDVGDGRFELRGDMSFGTAEQILRASQNIFGSQTRIEVNLSGVEKTDSAGLALLLEWITWATNDDREIRFVDIPKKVLAIAQTTEVGELLNRFHSSSPKSMMSSSTVGSSS